MRHRFITYIGYSKSGRRNKKMLPENLTLMQKIYIISVKQALNQSKESFTEIMAHFNKSAVQYTAKVDDQWRQVHLLKWNETRNTNFGIKYCISETLKENRGLRN